MVKCVFTPRRGRVIFCSESRRVCVECFFCDVYRCGDVV